MLRRMLTRTLTVVLAGAGVVVVHAAPALAFSVLGPYCDPYNRIRFDFKTDAKKVVSTVIWDDTRVPAVASISDSTNDGATTIVRIDNGRTVIPYPDEAFDYHVYSYNIYYEVRKWRPVWNGSARDWVSPHLCSP
ncbi:hypothetical protein M1L60_25825 [Actinoplanes sp. TRM 88003]|uniref:Uncharacterized protein n=1 Tax=Paractinoplanes aksuensis TaxID=2939490 RepID=A0ABT1DT56_9ACTN|nr:hypothetical protein [Actinoplanes aksuensis]MCO8274024.1 hypothetical protein [Actinoplanes aksuensis]